MFAAVFVLIGLPLLIIAASLLLFKGTAAKHPEKEDSENVDGPVR